MCTRINVSNYKHFKQSVHEYIMGNIFYTNRISPWKYINIKIFSNIVRVMLPVICAYVETLEGS